MSFSVEIKGLRELEELAKKEGARLTKEMDAVIENGAKVFVAGAKRDSAKNFGASGLAGAISFARIAPMNFEVAAARKYAPYLEWGTVLRVSVPTELQSYAIQFKGRGIKKNGGIYPRPYFFTQIPVAKRVIEQGLAAIIKAEKL